MILFLSVSLFHNAYYAASKKMNKNSKWFKLFIDVAKYAAVAALGAFGITVSGCACMPQFIF